MKQEKEKTCVKELLPEAPPKEEKNCVKESIPEVAPKVEKEISHIVINIEQPDQPGCASEHVTISQESPSVPEPCQEEIAEPAAPIVEVEKPS